MRKNIEIFKKYTRFFKILSEGWNRTVFMFRLLRCGYKNMNLHKQAQSTNYISNKIENNIVC